MAAPAGSSAPVARSEPQAASRRPPAPAAVIESTCRRVSWWCGRRGSRGNGVILSVSVDGTGGHRADRMRWRSSTSVGSLHSISTFRSATVVPAGAIVDHEHGEGLGQVLRRVGGGVVGHELVGVALVEVVEALVVPLGPQLLHLVEALGRPEVGHEAGHEAPGEGAPLPGVIGGTAALVAGIGRDLRGLQGEEVAELVDQHMVQVAAEALADAQRPGGRIVVVGIHEPATGLLAVELEGRDHAPLIGRDELGRTAPRSIGPRPRSPRSARWTGRSDRRRTANVASGPYSPASRSPSSPGSSASPGPAGSSGSAPPTGVIRTSRPRSASSSDNSSSVRSPRDGPSSCAARMAEPAPGSGGASALPAVRATGWRSR